MKKVFLVLLSIFVLSLCACSSNNELIGTWYSDSEGIVIIFTESETIEAYRIDTSVSDYGNPSVLSHTETYKVIDGKQIETYSTNGVLSTVYDYSIKGNTLRLTDNISTSKLTLQKASRSDGSGNKIVGHWKLLSAGYWDAPAYKYWKYDVVFYSDGTFVSKHKDFITEETKTTNSNYTLINDGRTLKMEFTTYSYWDFEFLSDSVMLVSTENSKLLYIVQ